MTVVARSSIVGSVDLVGAAEIADLLGVSRQRVNAIAASSPEFPAPVAELAAGRIWSRDAVVAWMRRRARVDEIRVVGVAGVAIELPAGPKDLVGAAAHLSSGVPVLLDARHLSSLAFRRVADAAAGLALGRGAELVEGGRTLLLVPGGRRLNTGQRKALEKYLTRTAANAAATRRQPMTYANLADYFRTEHGVELGDATLAELADVARTQANVVDVKAEVRGRDSETATGKTVTVKLSDVTRHLD